MAGCEHPRNIQRLCAFHSAPRGRACCFLDLAGVTPLLRGTVEVLFEGSSANYWVCPVTTDAVLTIDNGIVFRGRGR